MTIDVAKTEPEPAESWSPQYPPPDDIDPVTAVYLSSVDHSLLRTNLKLSVEERLLKAEAAAELSIELRQAGQRQRASHSG